MISCEQFLNLLDAYLDGTLPPEQTQEMEEHIQHCARCRDLVQMEKDLTALRAETEETPVPESLTKAWHAHVHKEETRSARRRNAFTGMLTAAAALVFTVAGTAHNRNTAPPESAMTDSAPMVMMARLGPAPVPTLWERITAYLGDMGVFLLEYWPVLACILLFGLVLPRTLPRILRKNCPCRRKKG